ncbi:MAG: 50S ribosomal protein L25 [Thermoleophilia bacterium]|jgi:large subunit ribosomal protein L25|nr:50S ribosomal protein L25 [Thermoleophilia bacterium]
MDNVRLPAHPRQETGSRAANRLRKQGLIPGVLYGHGKAAVMFAVEPAHLRAAMSTEAGRHAVLEVTLEGQKRSHRAIIKDLELDPVRHIVTHVDLQEIRLDEVIEAKVAVRYEGPSAGEKVGGMLDEATREVTVKGKVTDIPEHLAVDITALEIGDALYLRDLSIPEGFELLDDPEQVLCSVLMPRKVAEPVEGEEEEAAAVLEAEEAAEPEVIGKGAKEESGE